MPSADYLQHGVPIFKVAPGNPGGRGEKEIEHDEGTFYYVTYRFPDYANRVRTKKVEVTKRHFNMLSEGQRISVIYNLDKPDISFINDGELRSSFFKGFNIQIAFAIILAICGYGLFMSFK